MLSCDESLRKGQWSLEEDKCLRASVALLGESRWDAIAKSTGLKRSGKSCRLQWLNYLQPSLKQTPIGAQEGQIILRLHQKWGNKWARIARRLPGRTDNEIKNYWRGCLRKKTTQLLDQTRDCTSKSNTIQGTSLCAWSSDDDETDYNDETSLREDKVNNSSSGATGELVSSSLEDVLLSCPKLPYERHFSNWVSLFPGENHEFMGAQSRQRDVAGCCNWGREEAWDKLWDMDLFTSNT